MFCRQCGASMDEKDMFCAKCGYKREKVEAQQPNQQMQYQQMQYQQMQYQQAQYQQPVNYSVNTVREKSIPKIVGGIWLLINGVFITVGTMMLSDYFDDADADAPPAVYIIFGLIFLIIGLYLVISGVNGKEQKSVYRSSPNGPIYDRPTRTWVCPKCGKANAGFVAVCDCGQNRGNV